MSLTYGRVLPEIKHISDPQVWGYQNPEIRSRRSLLHKEQQGEEAGTRSLWPAARQCHSSNIPWSKSLILTWKNHWAIMLKCSTTDTLHFTLHVWSGTHWVVWDNTQSCSSWKNKVMRWRWTSISGRLSLTGRKLPEVQYVFCVILE